MMPNIPVFQPGETRQMPSDLAEKLIRNKNFEEVKPEKKAKSEKKD